jgi:hypothetical protein
MLGQAKINENLIMNLASNNKILENINSNLEGLTFSFKNQSSLNKMFETQLAQFAATIPTYDFEKIPRQPEISFENINTVITRDGKSTHDLPYPNHAREAKKHGGTTPNLRLGASLGDDPHKVTCILQSHHFSLPLHKKERNNNNNNNEKMVLLYYSMFSPLLDDSCLSFNTSSLYAGMFWFGCWSCM